MLKPYSMLTYSVATLALTLVPAPARAVMSPQDTIATAVHVMQVDLWPEYDDPRVLVILQGLLEPDLDVPRDFRFIIPQGAQLGMVGGIGDGGQHRHALYETHPREDGLEEIAYTLEQKTFYMEFYYDPLSDADQREFRYPIVSPFPMGKVLVNVQQPLEAQSFRVRPAAAGLNTDDRGFTYHQLGFDSLPANSMQWVTVAYEKAGREPSVSAAGAAGSSDSTTMRNLLIIGAILLVGAIGYGIFAGSAKRAAPTVATTAPRSAGAKRGHKFCTSCGTQMRSTDAFCAECGTAAPTRTKRKATEPLQTT